MNGSNPTRHVVIALALTALVFIIAGDSWSANIKRIVPVKPIGKVR